MIRKMLFILSAAALVFSACTGKGSVTADYGVIPLPQSTQAKDGEPFTLDKTTKIAYPQTDPQMAQVAEFLAEYINLSTGISIGITDQPQQANAIILTSSLEHENAEAYAIIVDDKLISVKGASPAGVFYAVQTLRKSILPGDYSKIEFPQGRIEDFPRFGYRGMHLDVARHFFPAEFVKKYIDLLALHNINRLHWHITDDQGWRIEIKKYPTLAELGSQRTETVIGRNTGTFDGIPHGGYYTQEEAREIVAYAADRFITVIPEVDLPGHMLGALKAFPELGCTGGPYEVAREWGVFDDVLCAGNEKVLPFLEDILTEIMDIFPSELIHIGGDECPKVRWEECPKCQAKIKELGLKSDAEHSAEERLQSYIITHVEKFLNDHGRRIIGWDEILEGGLAPNATVMSWRGMEGAITAAKLGNDAILVPTSHFYFDYYQTTNKDSAPLAFGGYVPLQKVYSFDPIPSVLTAEEAKHIIGVQANIWTEYVKTGDHVEYMVLPRMDALSEVQWTAQDKRDYGSFIKRLLPMLKLYDQLGYTYSTSVFDIEAAVTPDPDKGVIEVTLKTVDDAPVYYTLDGSAPTSRSNKYETPLQITESVIVKAIAIRPDITTPVYEQSFLRNKATMKPITLNQKPNRGYTFGGVPALVDGIWGSPGDYKGGSWIGFNAGDIEAIIDLQQPTQFSKAGVNTYVCTGDWIFGAIGFEVEISDDGENYTEVASRSYPEAEPGQQGLENIELEFDQVEARFVKLTIRKTQKMPDWHAGKGYPPFIFIDEIRID